MELVKSHTKISKVSIVVNICASQVIYYSLKIILFPTTVYNVDNDVSYLTCFCDGFLKGIKSKLRPVMPACAVGNIYFNNICNWGGCYFIVLLNECIYHRLLNYWFINGWFL